jgi:hypothetical protein
MEFVPVGMSSETDAVSPAIAEAIEAEISSRTRAGRPQPVRDALGAADYLVTLTPPVATC